MKKFLRVFTALTVFLLLVGCNNPEATKGLKTDYDIPLGLNSAKTLRTMGSWTKTGIINHWHSGTDAGPMIMYGVEGLLQYVRTTETYYYLLAESITEDLDGNTIIKIRDNATWHDGKPFTAMDVVAYYAIDYQNEICKYFSSISVINDKTVKIVWKSYLEPTSEAKIMLLAADTKLGSVQYAEFKAFVDQALDVIINLNDVTQEDLTNNYSTNIIQPYGKMWNSAASSKMGEILQGVRAYQPSWYVATGPYKLKKYTETDMILVKNENYYLDNSKSFETIYVYQTPGNINQIYSMLSNGSVDYFDGAPLPEVIDNIVANNKNMVHYKMIDQNSCGIFFNLEKSIWDSNLVREAFQYIFDRDMIRQLVAPYATTSYYSMLTMTKSQAEIWMNPDDFTKLKQYSFNQTKAKELLSQAGWSFKNGVWHDQDNKQISLVLGVENNTLFINMSQAVQSALNSFGINTTIKVGETWNTWFSTGRQTDSPYDFFVGVTDANSYTTHPYGFMKHFFDILDAHMLHLPVSDITRRWDVKLNRIDGKGIVNLVDELDKLYLVTDNDLRVSVGNIVYGFSEYNYGLQIFENMTGSFFDSSRVWGLPAIEELAKDNRNIQYIPNIGDKYFDQIADLNVYFTQGSVYGLGKLYPRD